MFSLILLVLLAYMALLPEVEQTLENPAREYVENTLGNLLRAYEYGGLSMLQDEMNLLLDERDPMTPLVQIYNAEQGSQLAGNLSLFPQQSLVDGSWQRARMQRATASQSLTIGLIGRQLTPNLWLIVGVELDSYENLRSLLDRNLLILLILIAVICLITSLILARFLRQRIADVVETADEIVEGNLSERIRSTLAGNEFDYLSLSLNRMIARIEELVGTTRSVTDSIAHDFRSPLTRLKVKLEQQLNDASTVDELRSSIRATLSELDTVLQSLNGLLEIVRVEGNLHREQMVDVNMQKIVDDLCDFYRPLAEEEGMAIELKSKPTPIVLGHPALLTHAVSNVIDNAIKYSNPGSRISVEVGSEPMGLFVVIADNGPGIPAEKREFVKRRFTRLDQSRTTPGAGLGLSLASAVIGQHGGSISILDNNPGARIVIRIPGQVKISRRFGWLH